MTTDAPTQVASLLRPASAQAEQGFLAAGRSLAQAVTILDRLNARFIAYITDLTNGALDRTGGGLAEAGQHVARLADAHAADAAALYALDGVVAATARRVTALHPITREVATLAMSARVVAGGMGNAGTDFLAFTDNIRAAAQRAGNNLSHVQQELGRVNQDLLAAHAAAAAFARRHGETIQAIPRRLEASLHSLSERRRLAGEAAASAHQRALAIARQVADQIVAMQIGDITRQRLEHMQQGAALLGETSAGEILPEGALSNRALAWETPAMEAGAHCPRVALILAAQLADTADALTHEGDRIATGLAQLSTAARAIGQLGRDVHDDTTSGRRQSFVTALESDVRESAAMFTGLRAADSSTEQHIHAVLQAAGGLAERLAAVQSVEEDIRIMGLNATLKCGRLGTNGRALAVVAQELRACSHRFAEEAAAVLGELKHLTTIASGLLDPQRQATHAALAESAAPMLAAVQRLQRLEQDLDSGMAQLQADADAVGQLVESALAQFAVRHALADKLRQAAQVLAADVARGGTGSTQIGAGETAVLDRIAASYTMTRERAVHAALAPLPQSHVTAEPAAVESELGCELF